MPFQSLRLSLRFIIPLAIVLAAFAYAIVPLVDSMTLRWFVRDLDVRSESLANALRIPLLEHIPEQSKEKVVELFDKGYIQWKTVQLKSGGSRRTISTCAG